MFSWTDFRAIASRAIEDKLQADPELRDILMASTPPTKILNDVGSPLPNSGLINQHPDPDDYLRIMRVHRDIAMDKNARESFAHLNRLNRIIEFLESSSDRSDSNPLFIVCIATSRDEYEFLYTPRNSKLIATAVGHLRKQNPKM